jgi:hypothetical protein
MGAGADMLSETLQVIRNRGANYGPIKPNHERIAALWSTLLEHPVTPVQVAMCMVGVKLARLMETPDHVDSAVDIAGYAACIRECQGDAG